MRPQLDQEVRETVARMEERLGLRDWRPARAHVEGLLSVLRRVSTDQRLTAGGPVVEGGREGGEVRLHRPVQARVVGRVTENDPPGTVALSSDRESLWYRCPCGQPDCHRVYPLALRREGEAAEHPSWELLGLQPDPRNYEKSRLTLRPSVHHVGHLHAWLKKGWWVQA